MELRIRSLLAGRKGWEPAQKVIKRAYKLSLHAVIRVMSFLYEYILVIYILTTSI